MLRSLWIAFISFVYIIPAAMYFYYKIEKGTILSVNNASDNLLGLFVQSLITVIPAVLILAVAVWYLKKDFLEEMYLKITTPEQKKLVVLSALLLVGMCVALLVTKEDKITVLYDLFFYLVIIAFFEETVMRGFCVYLLREYSTVVRYIIPNLFFALYHVFSYGDFGVLSASYVLWFLLTGVPRILLIGCLFQWIKEKTGTLWVAILLHAAWDYAFLFGIL